MHYVGVDLHKHSISVCAMLQAGHSRRVAARRRFRCADVEAIHAFFAELGSFEPYVERFEKNGQTFYRARFAGFGDRDAATAMCNELKKAKLSCLAMQS